MSFVHFLLGLCCGLVIGTAVNILHAQDLDGAAYATWYEGELPARSESVQAGGALVSPPRASSVSWPWSALAQCESTGRWHVATGNGYFGGLQMDMTFWRNHGGLAYAPRPDLASPAHQVAVAERGLRVQGWGAWPVCSRRIGVR